MLSIEPPASNGVSQFMIAWLQILMVFFERDDRAPAAAVLSSHYSTMGTVS